MDYIYIAKKNSWFDEGTEAKLLIDCNECGVFKGIKKGELDEELCEFTEFDILTKNKGE